ncbi:oligosaccharide flippase family protein, partial [Patescibacteria group bacterium]|nr:oligosaccharide flippase family protein [Patescibacteria group bacterium]
VLLERKLRFDLQVVVELIETLIFYGVSVFLAWRGAGVISYAWAVFLRGITGAVLINLLSPWPIGFRLRRKSLRRLLRFGVPYQANTVLAVVKDRLMNVFLWGVIGAGGVGILGWAQKWAQMPLRLIMDPIMKVTFPTFSRLQLQKKKLREALRFSIFSLAVIAFPMLMGISLCAGPLVNSIPKYEKWAVGVLPLALFAFNGAWAAISTPLTNAFNAVGKIKLTFRLMIFWTVLTWIFTPWLAVKYGYLGAAIALALVPISSVIVFRLAKKQFGLSVWRSVWAPLLATLMMAVVLLAWKTRAYPIGWQRLGSFMIVGAGVYGLSIWALAKNDLIRLMKVVKDAFAR